MFHYFAIQHSTIKRKISYVNSGVALARGVQGSGPSILQQDEICANPGIFFGGKGGGGAAVNRQLLFDNMSHVVMHRDVGV